MNDVNQRKPSPSNDILPVVAVAVIDRIEVHGGLFPPPNTSTSICSSTIIGHLCKYPEATNRDLVSTPSDHAVAYRWNAKHFNNNVMVLNI